MESRQSTNAQPERIPYGESEHAKRFVAEMLKTITVDDPASQSMVQQLAVLEDQMRECLTEMANGGGQFYLDRFGKPKEHPAAKRQIALHNEYGKLYRLLSLDQDPQGKLFD